MSDLFLKLFNMSITASWVVLAVAVLRLLLKKAPRWICCLLWGVVALRLIMPFSLESGVSLVPSAEVIPQDSIMSTAPVIDVGIPAVNEVVNPIITETLAPEVGDSVNPMQVLLLVASVIWIIGVVAMLLYCLISRLRLGKRVRISMPYRDNIYFCDAIDTPFILGILKPKIYIPSGIPEEQLEYIISHEKAHLKRLDHWWKPVGFALLTVYWFNPVIWAAYILLCRDIEKACDEKVVKDMNTDARKGYSEALVSCSIHRRMILACPLAFGEVGVKDRIKAVLHYKKPAFWVLLTAVAATVITAVCFLTNPVQADPQLEAVQRATAARQLLMEAVGSHYWSDKMPEYMLGRYIGEDHRLYIRLDESARDQEAALREALGEYADIAVFEYTDMTVSELKSYAQDIHTVLSDQGFEVSSVRTVQRTGNVVVVLSDEKDLKAANAAAAELQRYAYGIEVIAKSTEEKMAYADPQKPNYARIINASDHLMRCFYNQGYVNDYPDYYAGSYLGPDNLYHIILKKSVRNAKKTVDKLLGGYTDVVVYEYADYSRNEMQEYSNSLIARLTELGICVTGGGVEERTGIVTIGIFEEDIHLAEALMGKRNSYPFGQTDIPVKFEAGGFMVLE